MLPLPAPGPGRDGCRTPLPWAAGEPYAGLGTTVEPWLPLPRDGPLRAADRQADAPASKLSPYRVRRGPAAEALPRRAAHRTAVPTERGAGPLDVRARTTWSARSSAATTWSARSTAPGSPYPSRPAPGSCSPAAPWTPRAAEGPGFRTPPGVRNPGEHGRGLRRPGSHSAHPGAAPRTPAGPTGRSTRPAERVQPRPAPADRRPPRSSPRCPCTASAAAPAA